MGIHSNTTKLMIISEKISSLCNNILDYSLDTEPYRTNWCLDIKLKQELLWINMYVKYASGNMIPL